MQARATVGGYQLATGVMRMFIAAVLIALAVGGTGGYVVRALTYSASINAIPESHRPFVIEQLWGAYVGYSAGASGCTFFQVDYDNSPAETFVYGY
jgi:hypothetical protein